MQLCVNAGGSITGEHGVGADKISYMPMIFDQDSLKTMLEVKEVFNPMGLCNPGKAIPAPECAASIGKGLISELHGIYLAENLKTVVDRVLSPGLRTR
jgi:glycolate oxidase